MKNQNYTLGTRGTLNMLNKVVAKLARKQTTGGAVHAKEHSLSWDAVI